MTIEARPLRVTLFGVPRLRWEDVPVEPPTRKGLALLCFLAARAEPVERAVLADLLWGDAAAGLGNLRWELHQLRRLPGAAEWLRADAAGPLLAVRAVTDLWEFEAAMERGEFGRALELYGDPAALPLLAGPEPRGALGYREWLEGERARVDRLVQSALRGRALELEAEGSLSAARELTAAALRLDPLSEELHRAAMRLAFQQGDLAGAAAQFEACRRVLAEELGLSPMPETLELAAAVERAAAAPPPDLRAVRRIPPELLRPPLLVGREREWERMLAAWDRRQVIFVSGQPGVGKTRLVQDFIRAQVGEDVAVLRGCPGDQVVPFSGYARGWRGVYEARPELKAELAPWVRAEVSRFLPDVFPPDAAPEPLSSGEGVREDLRFDRAVLELYRQLLTSFGAALVDDIQYFDPTSWRLGGSALRELATDPALRGTLGRMVICFRTDEMPEPFVAGVSALVAAGFACHIELEPLGLEAITQLLASLGVDQPREQAQRLERLTSGNPLFLLEVLRKLFETGAWDDPAGPLPHDPPDGALLPDSVHQLIWRRLERLPPEALRTAQALAVLQEAATPARLAAVLEITDAELAELLVQLEQGQVVTGLQFSHDLLQESVTRSLPGPVARLLHGRAARLLEREGAPAALTAHHWQHAGEVERALPHYLLAAEQASANGAPESAGAWLDHVLRHATGELRRRAVAAHERGAVAVHERDTD